MLRPEIETWLRDTNPALAPAMHQVAEILLAADPRLTAYPKDGTVHFDFQGDLAAFVRPKGKRISLMFNRGAAIPGEYPHFEGDGPTARFMRFADLVEVENRAGELTAIARAWCQLVG